MSVTAVGRGPIVTWRHRKSRDFSASLTILNQKTKYTHYCYDAFKIIASFFKDLEDYGGDIPQPHDNKIYSLAHELVGVSCAR